MQLDHITQLVDAAFVRTSRGLPRWPDLYPWRDPPDDAYSRCTDPGKYRLIGARADAWLAVLVELGCAHVVDGQGRTTIPSGPRISTTTVAWPVADGALTLTLGRSGIGGDPAAGLVLGVGDPAVCATYLPDCGCDACDCGSQPLLDELDAWMWCIVNGEFRRLSRGDREITVRGDGMTSAHNVTRRGEIDAALADPAGWTEVSGRPWW